MFFWEDAKPDLAILTPYKGMVYMQWAVNQERIIIPTRYTRIESTGHMIDRERNGLVDNVLNIKQYDELFYSADRAIEESMDNGVREIVFIDSDIVIPTDGILRLRYPRYPLVTGLYWERNLYHYASIRVFKDGKYYPISNDEIDKQGPYFFVDACGAGYLYVDAEIFKRVSRPWFVWSQESDESPSEDIYFSEKVWNEVGLKPMVDRFNVAKHIGPAEYGREITWTSG